MKATKTTIMALVMVLAIAATPVLAAKGNGGKGGPGQGQRQRQEGPGGQRGPEMMRGGMQGMGILRMLRGLDLTEEQQAKVKEIVTTSKEKIKAAREAVQTANQNLRAAVDEGKDASTLRQLAAAVGASMGDQAVLRASMTSSIKSVLTSEQLAKFEEVKTKMKERAKEMKNKGQGRRGRRPGEGNEGGNEEELDF